MIALLFGLFGDVEVVCLGMEGCEEVLGMLG